VIQVTPYCDNDPQAEHLSPVLTLATDSYFATMTGMNAVTVYQQPGTEMFGVTSIANGQSVR
jgi:hypothetical protein